METQSQELESELEFLSPLFLGAYAENKEVLEGILSEYTEEHSFWRQKYQLADSKPISTEMKHSEHYKLYLEKIKKELKSLTSKLKNTVPIYNPRYIGHMASDLMLPALLAQLVTTFYNPNNSSTDAGDATIQMELDMGIQFAELFGFNTKPDAYPCAWGHLTTGGTNANHESLWNFRAVKYYPVALVEALNIIQLDIKFDDDNNKSPSQYTPWELINLSVDEVLALRKRIFNRIEEKLDVNTLKNFFHLVEENRLETLGSAQFFANHWKLQQPVVLVPSTAYSFWKKAMKVLGFGSASLIKIGLTESMRMDENELDRILDKLHSQNIPVLAVVGVLGTTDFGTIDPIDSIVELQKKYADKGLNFYIHVDASYGGYLMTLLKNEQGKMIPRADIISQWNNFPSERVYKAFQSIANVDSITIAPHTFGYLPQGTGGFISRNRETVKLLAHSESNLLENNDEINFDQLSRFILDGTRPGAKAAAIYVTHKVLPLTAEGFGRVIKQTIRASEYLTKKIDQLKTNLKDKVLLSIPFTPDSNIITLAINPTGNHSLIKMNEFMMKIFKQLSYNPDNSLQGKEFLASIATLELNELSESEKENIFNKLDLKTEEPALTVVNSLITLKHSLMNPWLLSSDQGINYIDRYCDYLESIICEQF